MELTQLLQRRVKIALNAAQTDPANSDSIKAVLSVLTQCLWHHSTALQLAESQLSCKVGDAEFKRALSGKLSVKQFLGYFQKIQRVVQKMQNYWSSNEQKTQDLLQKQREKLQEQLGDAIDSRINEIIDQMEEYDLKQQHNEQHMQQYQQQIQQYHQQMQLYQQQYRQLESEIYQLQKRTKLFSQQNNKSESSPREVSEEKMRAVLQGLREIQTHFNQTHYQIKSLLQSIIQPTTEKIALPHSNQQKVQGLDIRVMRCQELLPNRWIWEWNSQAHLLNWEARSGRRSLSIERSKQNVGKLIIKNGGFYKLTIGYLVENQHYGNLKVSCSGKILCNIDMEGNGNNCLCKTTMLYSYIPNQGLLTIQLQNSNTTRGFLQIENFD